MKNATPGLTWLIEHILPRGELTVMQGPLHVGRSLLLLDWALCSATGKSWFGHLVHPGSVAFCSTEKLQDLGQRARAWYATYQSDVDLPVQHTPISFFELEPLSEENYFTASEQLVEEIEDMQDPPSLIILDVEGTNERQARVLAYRLWQYFGVTVLLTSSDSSRDDILKLVPSGYKDEQEFLLHFPGTYGTSALQLRLQSVARPEKDFPPSHIIECCDQQTA